MKYWILRELDATLIITHDPGLIHPSTEQVHKQFSTPYGLHEAVLAAIYSASAELRAMDFGFLLHQEVIPDPMLKKYLVVLFRSTELPA